MQVVRSTRAYCSPASLIAVVAEMHNTVATASQSEQLDVDGSRATHLQSRARSAGWRRTQSLSQRQGKAPLPKSKWSGNYGLAILSLHYTVLLLRSLSHEPIWIRIMIDNGDDVIPTWGCCTQAQQEPVVSTLRGTAGLACY